MRVRQERREDAEISVLTGRRVCRHPDTHPDTPGSALDGRHDMDPIEDDGSRSAPGRTISRSITPKDHMSDGNSGAAIAPSLDSERTISGAVYRTSRCIGSSLPRRWALLSHKSSSFQACSAENHTILLGFRLPIA